MKKSEMISLLIRDLIDSGPNVEFQARMVLARIESCGMLPPTIEVEPTFNKEFGKVKKNIWEDEDV